jgi:hypothetical protein
VKKSPPPFRISNAVLNDLRVAQKMDEINAITLHVGELLIDQISMGECVTIGFYGAEQPSDFYVFSLSGINISVSPESLAKLRGTEIIIEERPFTAGVFRPVMCLMRPPPTTGQAR